MIDNLREIIRDRMISNPQFFSNPLMNASHIIDVAISIIHTRDKSGPKGGGFVHAIIDNDLELATTKADHINIHALKFYVDINRHFHIGDKGDIKSLLTSIYENASEITLSNRPWNEKFDLIFSDVISSRVIQLSNLDYMCPDLDYEDDVWSFMNAFKNKLNEL
jgi:hypothetical protein